MDKKRDKKDIRIAVLSYPDYIETDIYTNLINQLEEEKVSYKEMDLSMFDVNNKPLLTERYNATNFISVGGDGTTLKGMHFAYLHDSLLLPLGLGEIGYLVNSDKRKYRKLIRQVTKSSFDESMISKRTVISCPSLDPNWPIFNEIALSKTGNNTLLKFNIEFENESVDVKADGLILSTSGGSTAYSYSAGGPIVDPSLESIVITPIAPFSKFPRSIVLPSSSSIRINIDTPSYFKTLEKMTCDIFFDGVLVNNLINNSIKSSDPISLEISENDRKVKLLGVSSDLNVREFLSQILR